MCPFCVQDEGLDELYCVVLMFESWICRRTVVSIPNGPSDLAVTEAAWGLARYAAICQVRFSVQYVKEFVKSISEK